MVFPLLCLINFRLAKLIFWGLVVGIPIDNSRHANWRQKVLADLLMDLIRPNFITFFSILFYRGIFHQIFIGNSDRH